MPVADTSFLVALRNPEDAHHSRALGWARKAGPFRVPAVILSEYLAVVWSHARHAAGSAAANQQARQALEDLEAQPVFVVDPAYDPDVASRVYRGHAGLSYADAVAVAVVRATRDEFFTFDKAQARAVDA